DHPAARHTMNYDITCTLGTTTDSDTVLEEMIRAGMNGARINTAYATTDDYTRRIEQAREVAAGRPMRIMLDIKGPQIRLGAIDPYSIRAGQELLVGYDEDHQVYLNKDIHDDMSVGDPVLLENGTIRTVVTAKYTHDLRLKVVEAGDGVIYKHMGVNVPGVDIRIPFLSEGDKSLITYALDHDIERIALSFVRNADDVLDAYSVMREYDPAKAANIQIVAKVESEAGVRNLDNIIRRTQSASIDLAVMVARGDLAVELGETALAGAQEDIISTCRRYGIPVIVGTGVLESMQRNRRPTRAEALDAYHILKSGADGIMLSAETSFGEHPVLVVQTLREIIDDYANRKVSGAAEEPHPLADIIDVDHHGVEMHSDL
ncbi:MAG: pyruvate kinase, partial [Nanoarchaeota archaeon]